MIESAGVEELALSAITLGLVGGVVFMLGVVSGLATRFAIARAREALSTKFNSMSLYCAHSAPMCK